jgi:hypothetical protein
MMMQSAGSSRRNFLKQALGVTGSVVLLNSCEAGAQTTPKQILVNHVGFLPGNSKLCLVEGKAAEMVTVFDAASSKQICDVRLVDGGADLGSYRVGDLSEIRQSGTFEVRCAGCWPATLIVGDDVYLPAIRKSAHYFAIQRCGDSKTGHHAPCHLDDGLRQDNGQHHDVTGGWHDACDLRKWVTATIYGMIGLSRALNLLGPEKLDHGQIIDELQWGNAYFRKMQEPDGYLMDCCGGDDGNNYTDNRIGTADDRVIHTDPCELPAQFHFIAAQASLSRLTRAKDPAYADACDAAAAKCLDWCVTKRSARAAASLGAAIIACAQLHRSNPEMSRITDFAAGFADQLVALQVREGETAGFFRTAPDNPEPYRQIMHGNLPLIGLCEAIEQFPDHPHAASWRDALQLHASHLRTMSQRSAFGTIPFGLYNGKDPGGNRRIGQFWYRWFMKPRDETSASDWWVGINAHLASNGVGLCQASRLLGDAKLRQLAQRQLDWIVGVNPFNASTITDVGRNQPAIYRTGQFKPATPLIPGGVMNGLGGDALDNVCLESGSYHTCEYWTPMVAYTMWLMAELMTSR